MHQHVRSIYGSPCAAQHRYDEIRGILCTSVSREVISRTIQRQAPADSSLGLWVWRVLLVLAHFYALDDDFVDGNAAGMAWSDIGTNAAAVLSELKTELRGGSGHTN